MTEKELFASLAKNVKALRLARGMSQEDLVEESGLSVSYISLIERGRTNPSTTALYAIAKALKTKSSKLLPF